MGTIGTYSKKVAITWTTAALLAAEGAVQVTARSSPVEALQSLQKQRINLKFLNHFLPNDCNICDIAFPRANCSHLSGCKLGGPGLRPRPPCAGH